MDEIKKCFMIANHLFLKVFGKQKSEKDKEFEKWACNHEKSIKKILNWERFTKDENYKKNIDLDLEWQRLQAQVQKKNILLSQQFLKYAAVFLLPLAISISVLYWGGNFRNHHVVAKVDSLAPGKKKAELLLSDGSVLSLYPTKKNQIEEIDGTIISNDSLTVSYADRNQGKEYNTRKKAVQNEIRVGHGQEYSVVLADGTKVWLNSLSSLRFPTSFTGKKRVVSLNGEAYFEVKHKTNQPFIVQMNSYELKVLGTSFNVSSYSDDQEVRTTLLNGKVSIEQIDGNQGKKIVLKPDEQLVFNKSDLSLDVKKVDAAIYCNWSKGNFWLNNEPLEDVMKKLERWYNIKVFFLDDELRKELFTGKLPRFENFHSLATLMEEVSDVRFDVKNQTVSIRKK